MAFLFLPQSTPARITDDIIKRTHVTKAAMPSSSTMRLNEVCKTWEVHMQSCIGSNLNTPGQHVRGYFTSCVSCPLAILEPVAS